MSVGTQQVTTAVVDFADALQAEEPAARATADLVRRVRHLLVHRQVAEIRDASVGLFPELRPLQPLRYGPVSARALLLELDLTSHCESGERRALQYEDGDSTPSGTPRPRSTGLTRSPTWRFCAFLGLGCAASHAKA
jgi:hypothetical protein